MFICKFHHSYSYAELILWIFLYYFKPWLSWLYSFIIAMLFRYQLCLQNLSLLWLYGASFFTLFEHWYQYLPWCFSRYSSTDTNIYLGASFSAVNGFNCQFANSLLMIVQQNKKERKKVREVGILKKDPETIREQIEKLEKMSKYLTAEVLGLWMDCCFTVIKSGCCSCLLDWDFTK